MREHNGFLIDILSRRYKKKKKSDAAAINLSSQKPNPFSKVVVLEHRRFSGSGFKQPSPFITTGWLRIGQSELTDREGSEEELVPAKPVGHDPHTEGSHHPTHAEDGHGHAPHDGANAVADWLPVSLHPGVVEERSQFLRPQEEKQTKNGFICCPSEARRL